MRKPASMNRRRDTTVTKAPIAPFTVGDVRNRLAFVEGEKAAALPTTEQINEYNKRVAALIQQVADDNELNLVQDVEKLREATPLSSASNSLFKSLNSWLEKQHRIFIR